MCVKTAATKLVRGGQFAELTLPAKTYHIATVDPGSLVWNRRSYPTLHIFRSKDASSDGAVSSGCVDTVYGANT